MDEKSQFQALDGSQPMLPAMPERRIHDYVRDGITSLFAAFNIAHGTVIGELHRQHHAAEFKKFLITIDDEVPLAEPPASRSRSHVAGVSKELAAQAARTVSAGSTRRRIQLVVATPRSMRRMPWRTEGRVRGFDRSSAVSVTGINRRGVNALPLMSCAAARREWNLLAEQSLLQVTRSLR
ncbi:hypothetical protein [Nonomuraea sp. NPDC049129]|uniref:hypothetical protein n=1 Tax=Nonomuraea sp. NPDC049129 TaxID=3155272 RepID=UPI0033D7E613